MSIREAIRLYNPLTWPTWCLLGILFALTRLPVRFQMKIGKGIGKLFYHLTPKMHHITTTNISLCFPELSPKEQTTLIQKNYEALGIGLMETAMAWWMSDKQLEKCQIHIQGIEHIEEALAKGKGVILLGPHFTCLEMVGRLIGAHHPFAVLYRPHKKYLISYIQERFRKKYRMKQIPRHRMREVLNTLEDNQAIWYAYDVDGGDKRSVFAPFFHIPTASLTAVSRISEMSGASVVPVSFYRSDDHWGYQIHILPRIENFPSHDFLKDATTLNLYLENAIRQKPEQYIWQYKRFKTRPLGEKRFY